MTPGPSATALFSANAGFIEALYEDWLRDPATVATEWRAWFDSLHTTDGASGGKVTEVVHSRIRESFRRAALRRTPCPAATPAASSAHDDKQVAVLQLINAYRFRGHRRANLDPLQQQERPDAPDLNLEFHGLDEADLDTQFSAGSLYGVEHAPLREILDVLQRTYTNTIGSEYMYLTDTEQKRWIQNRLEANSAQEPFSHSEKHTILERLIAANSLEQYLHTKYVGQKRFSLEGGESLIPLLDELTQRAGGQGVKEVIIGMAHRGRLNVLVNILGKLPADLFSEFEGKIDNGTSSGDVKYHMGFSSDVDSPGGVLHKVLAFNPSHLEIINPVVEGSVRARQERRGDEARNEVLAILIHGDAAFAGQGVIMETLNLSQTRGYTIGGTVHIVINNQIGYTTSDPLDSRSTLYCTDVAKMIQAPIFHVNGDDPEAVVFITQLALDYRMTFNKDVVVDLVCYRRHGHSEADEPSATQPIMYQRIENHALVNELYAEKLIAEGVIDASEPARIQQRYLDKLESNQPASRPVVDSHEHDFLIDYSPFQNQRWTAPADTTLALSRIEHLTERMTMLPADFRLHRSVQRIIDNRKQMGQGLIPLDWGYAETLAYASLVDEGHPVRLSGQDSGRGTFFHRHAVLVNQDNGDSWIPLQNIAPHQARFLVINSLLSENAVLGFEVGYSTAEPNSLVIWEAQFGDFANNAQVIIDQFISSSEAKWQRLCGLVMMLPHGYEGQGPEHSSARLERYLQLCAEQNMQVCMPSTPAQMFHLLRRQILRPLRKPLIIMSPKSLLRHKLSHSTLADLSDHGFRTVIDEIDDIDKNAVTRLVLCSGKVYFDLLEARRKHNPGDIAIVRIEQLYPFPADDVREILDSYPNAHDIVWAQEEPRNQGSWYYMQSRRHLGKCLDSHHTLSYAGRHYSASPAVGYMHLHLQQQTQLVAQALFLNRKPKQRQQAKR